MNAVIAEVTAELDRAKRQHPRWPNDPIHAAAIVAEECGELQKAVLEAVYEPWKGSRLNIRAEAVQTAAMCLRFIAHLGEYEWFRSTLALTEKTSSGAHEVSKP
jgi:hypothetical protein